MNAKRTFLILIAAMCTSGFGEVESVSGLIGRSDAAVKLQGVIDDYVREVVEEAKGVRVIYTDGAFDDDIRCEAKRRGVELEPISMMMKGGSESLKEAVFEKNEDVAVQLGFELWKRAGKELPSCSGVLARLGKMSETDRQRGIKVAERLGERILELYENGVVTTVSDKKLIKRFRVVQWRISRIARMRAERDDRAGNTNLATRAVNLSDRLDDANPSLNKILQDVEKARERTMRTVTPHGSLQMALARADFTTAQRFAEPILRNDPDDPAANFGVGMNYYRLKQWARAEVYLRRCLIKKPKEPAVWNNLAMICMYTERYDEGLKLAHKALEIVPESAEVKDTIKQIREAREKAAARKP